MSRPALTVLILGGYGTFGGRLARRLAGSPHLNLIVAGRSSSRANRFVAGLPNPERVRPVALDRSHNLAVHLATLRPDILVDATGPFQSAGPEPYRVVETCLELGIHYLDLADSTEFVLGINDFDAAFKAKSLVGLSGLSTFPSLSGAVIGALAQSLGRVEHIAIGAAPSPFAVVGRNVVRAIASYAGRPIAVLHAGGSTVSFGLTNARRMTIAPPGRLPMQSRVFSLVDVPDLKLLPARYPDLRSIWIGAGTEPAVVHRCLIGMAWLVRIRILPSLVPFATLFWRMTAWLRWGEDRGGLIVAVAGKAPDGTDAEHSFHLVAEGGDGPFIPCLAAEAVIRGALAGRWPEFGARPANDAVPLTEFLSVAHDLRITTGVRLRSDAISRRPLYEQVLGDSWAMLPPSVRALHDSTETRTYAGAASVDRGAGILARVLAALIGFPAAGDGVPVRVTFEHVEGAEIWRRDFAGQRFTSRQSVGRGRFEHLVVERFGLVSVGLALVIEEDRLRIVVRRWSVWGLPLPLSLAPGGHTVESERDGRFHFHVEIGTRWTGLIVRYRGWLTPAI